MRATPRPVIVSLTSIPSRNGTLGPTLESLAKQTRPPDQIRLYLTPDCTPPSELAGLKLESRIEHVGDRGPLTKLAAALDPSVPDEAIVITCDDDMIYDSKWLERLLEAHSRHPSDAIGFSGWNVGGFLHDRYNGTYDFPKTPGVVDVLEGFAGVLYQKSFFGEDLWHAPELFYWVDDVWISSYLRAKSITRRTIAGARPIVQHRQAGLHTRPDFVALNRAAAIAGFGDALPKVTLSIIIPSLHKRSESLAALLAELASQDRASETEVLIAIDAGGKTTGSKRNQLVQIARGQYIVHIDDDDMVSHEYIPKILAAIDGSPGVDCVLLRGCRTVEGTSPVLFDYEVGLTKVGQRDLGGGVIWAGPSHLTPIKADIVKKVPFPNQSKGEDVVWCQRVCSLVKTGARAGKPSEILYHYQWDPSKTPTPSVKLPPTRPAVPERTRIANHQQIFTPQYRVRSGPGSTEEASRPYREFLEQFVRHGPYKIRSILDLGCGDLEVMSRIDLRGIHYHGVDIIRDRQLDNMRRHPTKRFSVGDARTFALKGSDLLVMKDVLQHWDNSEVVAFLQRFGQGNIKYALITNDNYGPTVNQDAQTGTWRALDLTKTPFTGIAGICSAEVKFSWQCRRGEFIDTKDVVLLKRY